MWSVAFFTFPQCCWLMTCLFHKDWNQIQTAADGTSKHMTVVLKVGDLVGLHSFLLHSVKTVTVTYDFLVPNSCIVKKKKAKNLKVKWLWVLEVRTSENHHCVTFLCLYSTVKDSMLIAEQNLFEMNWRKLSWGHSLTFVAFFVRGWSLLPRVCLVVMETSVKMNKFTCDKWTT